ncbi:hypothetical protein MSG28_006753 [Choristoneura fumiferana]|uniref:Uncharacterized protein n=1 Tax=Choristoneura fumiferana TaxID=7141 RepID=A0ACC0JL99_CHOFU|nr:hypothetical protein MSG28_006753 [Choristoneura fumiferana]
MLIISLVLVLCVFGTDTAMQNAPCPVVSTREIDLKELDGKWYVAGAATDLPLQGDCAMVVFNHKNDNTTDVSISWINNNTASFYNGSVALTMDPNNSSGDLLLITYTDQKIESYSFLDVNYEHYAVIFSCNNSDDGNSSTYELWKLSRSPHLKDQDAEEMDQAINYYVQDTEFVNFNATEDSCQGNGGNDIHSSVAITSVATIALFRRFY